MLPETSYPKRQPIPPIILHAPVPIFATYKILLRCKSLIKPPGEQNKGGHGLMHWQYDSITVAADLSTV